MLVDAGMPNSVLVSTIQQQYCCCVSLSSSARQHARDGDYPFAAATHLRASNHGWPAPHRTTLTFNLQHSCKTNLDSLQTKCIFLSSFRQHTRSEILCLSKRVLVDINTHLSCEKIGVSFLTLHQIEVCSICGGERLLPSDGHSLLGAVFCFQHQQNLLGLDLLVRKPNAPPRTRVKNMGNVLVGTRSVALLFSRLPARTRKD